MERRIESLRFHAISADALLGELPANSKLTVNLPFFEQLRDSGRDHARHWLSENRGAIGRRQSLDLANLFY